jgi:NTP pyrophosphatase (non-canonical NTP hydrolase)
MLAKKLNNHIEQRAERESRNFTVYKKINAVDSKILEALVILSEECAEIIQEVSKIQRFGIDEMSYHTHLTHRATLEQEVGDVLAMIDILVDQGILNTDKLEENKQAKFNKLKKWSSIYE